VSNASWERLFAPAVQYIAHKSSQTVTRGRSQGFGFVEFTDDNVARSAMAELNGKDCEGRPRTVNAARLRDERSGSAGVRHGNLPIQYAIGSHMPF
jgi:RNA recognition motif-containing protein